MNTADLMNRTTRTKPTELKSPRPNGPKKLDFKRSGTLTDYFDVKYSVCSSKIPRLQIPAAFWYKETLKEARSKTNGLLSLIPRSKSPKGNENRFKFMFSKTEPLKKEVDESPTQSEINELLFREGENKHLDPDLEEMAFSSVKSFLTLKEDGSDSVYQDAEEDILSILRGNRPDIKKNRKIKESLIKENFIEKQDKTVQNLYESLKCMVGPLLDKLSLMNAEKNDLSEIMQVHSTTTLVIEGAENHLESIPDFSTIQGQYEVTLKDISNIWKNTVSLISSVKDHTFKLVEENDKSFDKEQLTLEAEMLQLAIDFAISYSKLKTDSLMKFAKRHFCIKSLEKTELENFMDSKTFPAVYNNDDLAAMAKTVQDLNISVSKGGEIELD